MTLVFNSPFVRLYSISMELYSLYSYGTLLYLRYHSSINYSLELPYSTYMVSLPERCSGISLIFIYMDVLYHTSRCRVIFSNVSMVLILVNIISGCFMTRLEGTGRRW
jgi:hypothetical protein